MKNSTSDTVAVSPIMSMAATSIQLVCGSSDSTVCTGCVEGNVAKLNAEELFVTDIGEFAGFKGALRLGAGVEAGLGVTVAFEAGVEVGIGDVDGKVVGTIVGAGEDCGELLVPMA